MCVCARVRMHTQVFENVEMVLHSYNLLQVPGLWSEMIEAHIHLILANQELDRGIAYFLILSLKHAVVV